MTRDLASEFGEFNVESLTLTVPDGEYALFDHIYLARSKNDLELAPATISPELANQKARRELAAEVLKKALPAVVKLKMADGRTGTGTIIEPQGYVITTGHLLVQPNQEVQVMLADGREFTGKSLGIDREHDLGVLKIDSEESFPQLDINTASELSDQHMYVGAIYPPNAPADKEPLTHIVGVRRVVDGLIWSDFDAPEWTAGGPLLDRDAKQIGLLISRSQFGGFQYLIGAQVRENYDRMKRSEVWGEWPSGSGPMVGVIIRTLNDGCRIIEVIPDSPAAAAGLAVDDYLTKVEGQEVGSLGEIYQLLKAKNPGDKVKITFQRGEKQQETEMTLTPRWP
jgi:S1-C subfamily serine protease